MHKNRVFEEFRPNKTRKSISVITRDITSIADINEFIISFIDEWNKEDYLDIIDNDEAKTMISSLVKIIFKFNGKEDVSESFINIIRYLAYIAFSVDYLEDLLYYTDFFENFNDSYYDGIFHGKDSFFFKKDMTRQELIDSNLLVNELISSLNYSLTNFDFDGIFVCKTTITGSLLIYPDSEIIPFTNEEDLNEAIQNSIAHLLRVSKIKNLSEWLASQIDE